MSEPPTIILVPYEPALVAELRQRDPEIRMGALETAGDHPRPVWLFIDWVLPESSGLELCRQLRLDPATSNARLSLVLEDEDREMQKRALKAGADDYLIGPLTAELIQSRLCTGRGQSARPDPTVVHGLLRLDKEAFQVRAGGRPVPMALNEFLLLQFFLENRDRLLSRGDLMKALKDGRRVDDRTVDVWIGRLRRALGKAQIPDPIRTVRQLGYVYDSF
jgi:two-component system phosphate regulon response regulator PhoB